MALIEASHLAKIFRGGGDGSAALRDVSLTIDRGEFVAIMGPSGSGKSTLLHILGFLDRPSRGTYVFDGQRTDDVSDNTLASFRNTKVGFVFQASYLLERATVLQNVELPLLYARIQTRDRDRRAREALETVGLSHRLSHLPSQLSGGEQQRVAIARALVNAPLMLLADEPTGNLDSSSGQKVMDALETLHQGGHTILLITHETYTAEYAERIVRVRDGVIVATETVERRRTHENFHK